MRLDTIYFFIDYVGKSESGSYGMRVKEGKKVMWLNDECQDVRLLFFFLSINLYLGL